MKLKFGDIQAALIALTNLSSKEAPSPRAAYRIARLRKLLLEVHEAVENTRQQLLKQQQEGTKSEEEINREWQAFLNEEEEVEAEKYRLKLDDLPSITPAEMEAILPFIAEEE